MPASFSRSAANWASLASEPPADSPSELELELDEVELDAVAVRNALPALAGTQMAPATMTAPPRTIGL